VRDVVKVFPADVSGPAYLRALRSPLPQVPLMPTGGVHLTTAESFLKAGACCLGVGGRSWNPRRLALATLPAFASLLPSMPRSSPEFARPDELPPFSALSLLQISPGPPILPEISSSTRTSRIS
jgi:KDPG/KHG aldolase